MRKITFIDSDGVIADFDSYLASHLGRYTHNPEEAYKIMVEDYENCFHASKELPHSRWYLDLLKEKDCYILTSLSKREKLEPYCKKVSVDDVIKKHIENKYRWYEERGISREKVIITSCASDKIKFCTPGAVLYDDRKDTIEKWNNAGGVGIHVYNKHWN